MKISLCAIVKNEEKRLVGFFEKMKSQVDEIIIVDTGSNDESVSICEKYADKVIILNDFNGFDQARNVSIKHSSGDWNLILDIDEFILEKDMKILKSKIEENKFEAYQLQRYNYIGSGMWSLSNLVRIFKNNPNVYYSRRVHESVRNSLPNNIIPVIPVYIHHFPVNLELKKVNREKILLYIRWIEEYLKESPYDSLCRALLAVEYLSIGEVKEALSQFYIALKHNPDSPDINLFFGYMKLETNDFDESKRTFEKILNVTKNDANNHYYIDKVYTGLAKLEYKNKNYDDALNYCEKIKSKVKTASAHSYINSALLLKSMNNKYEAMEQFKLAIEINPLVKDEKIYFQNEIGQITDYSLTNTILYPFQDILIT